VTIAFDEAQKAMDIAPQPDTTEEQVVDFDLIGDGKPDIRKISKTPYAHRAASVAMNRGTLSIWSVSGLLRMVAPSFVSFKKVP
jgi:hypothetical protein